MGLLQYCSIVRVIVCAGASFVASLPMLTYFRTVVVSRIDFNRIRDGKLKRGEGQRP